MKKILQFLGLRRPDEPGMEEMRQTALQKAYRLQFQLMLDQDSTLGQLEALGNRIERLEADAPILKVRNIGGQNA